jgi:hypothetical protein
MEVPGVVLRACRRPVRGVADLPERCRVDVTGNFVVSEKWHRLVFVRVLHQQGLRELETPRSSEISKNEGSSHFRAL